MYKTAKFAPVWTTILTKRAIFVQQTSTEHALYQWQHFLQKILENIFELMEDKNYLLLKLPVYTENTPSNSQSYFRVTDRRPTHNKLSYF